MLEIDCSKVKSLFYFVDDGWGEFVDWGDVDCEKIFWGNKWFFFLW